MHCMRLPSRFITLLLIALVVGVMAAGVTIRQHQGSRPSAVAESIQIEWPNSATRVGDVGQLRAHIADWPVETYDLYWSVDGQDEQIMQNAFHPYPHKVRAIDTTDWDWRKDGQYTIAFRAEQEGRTVATSSVTIATPVSVIPAASQSGSSTGSGVAGPIDQSAAAITALPPGPTTGENLLAYFLTKDQPAWSDHEFSITAPGKRAGEFYLFWQAEDGEYIPVPNDIHDPFEKHALINFTSWQWKGDGPYRLSFIAQDLTAKEFARTVLYIERVGDRLRVSGEVEDLALAPAEGVDPVAGSQATRNRSQLAPYTLFTPNTQARAFLGSRDWSDSSRRQLSVLADTPQAVWLTGGSDADRRTVLAVSREAAAANAVPVFVLYNIPMRDCASYSRGGARNTNDYVAWAEEIASALSEDPAVIVLEPDALASMGCLNSLEQSLRLEALREVVKRFARNPNVSLYVDIGHPYWLPPDVAAERLRSVGIEQAAGFSLNVSNFIATEENIRYGEIVSQLTNQARFIIDTSRNGAGAAPDLAWCNPWGRQIGQPTTVNPGHDLVDALLWVKNPGESDGTCNGGPSAGTFWPEYAFSLVP